MAKSLEYDIVQGDLGAIRRLELQGYRLQTGRELQDDRCKDGREQLQELGFYVANGNAFYIDPKTGALSWAHTDGEHNLIIQSRYLERALVELPREGIFRPSTAQESLDTIYHRCTKRFVLNDLELVQENNEWSFMLVQTADYNALNPSQRKAAAAVGFTAKNIAYLNKKGITQTRLWLPNPKYLTQVFKEQGREPIWRASWLYIFDYSSVFLAYDGNVYGSNFRLRGVRREASVSEPSAPVGADAQKIVGLSDCYKTILANPNQALRALDDKTVAGLLSLVSRFYSRKA